MQNNTAIINIAPIDCPTIFGELFEKISPALQLFVQQQQGLSLLRYI
jgi:hypothetical protein